MVIPRIKSDLVTLLKGIDDGTFSEIDLDISNEISANVMLAADILNTTKKIK